MERMDGESKAWLHQLLYSYTDREAWMVAVRYGLGTLIEDQQLLWDVLENRARYEGESSRGPSSAVRMRRLIEDLGLKLTRE